METTELVYPVFEANQVLSNAHLNDMFEYLDEQTRLTRADLIGIGIVCGLEATRDPGGGIRLTRGCGVTSQGYLIVEPADVTLAHVRKYTLPFEVGYQPFTVPGSDPAAQFALWELFDDDDEPGAVPLATSGLLLDRMAVVLFLELRQDRTRNCSPKGCDDRGSEVTTTVRRLLIDTADLRKVIEAGRSLGSVPLGADLAKRLRLADLRMPRFDVPNSGPASSEKVLAGFQATFRKNGLASATAAALTALYAAFEPIIAADHPAGNPFASFASRFAFLDSTPLTVGQVRFMQYYWDFFDDLLAAYDEVRAKGIDLLCACCPPQGLYPRHLVAGVLAPDAADPFEYRTRFVPSPAVSNCVERTREVRMLFRRLVTMISQFTEAPGGKGIKATPSVTGAPLSDKAIPYYYRQDGSPRLYEVWNPQKTREMRADRNLGYRADEYVPAAPAFVTDPLRFDLEPHDFLRIEGHLGTHVHAALESLLSLRRSHRLPIDVIALRTGAFDENMTVDLTKEHCRFQDLETLYETLKSDLACFLVKEVQYFYSLPLAGPVVTGQQARTPTLPILAARAPRFAAQPGTIGHGIERMRNWKPGEAQPFVLAVVGVPDLPSQAMSLTSAMSDLAGLLGDDVPSLDLAAFDSRYSRIVDIARSMDDARRDGRYDAPRLSERLDDIVYRCRRDPFEALAQEYRRRLREAKQEQFLSTFLQRHPGVQHKAGVPLGGTFILVYHEDPAPAKVPVPLPGRVLPGEVIPGEVLPGRVLPGEVVPGRVLPGEVIPGEVLPGRVFPGPVVPERVLPGRIVPDLFTDLVVERLSPRVRPGVGDSADNADTPDSADSADISDEVIITAPSEITAKVKAVTEALAAAANRETAFDGLTANRMWSALAGLGAREDLLKIDEIRTIWQILPGVLSKVAAAPGSATERIYESAIDGLADGTVIADFFLPYGLHSGCPPIQYQLPPLRLRVTTSKSCTNADGFSEVTVAAEGAIGDLSVQVDQGAFAELANPLLLGAGKHTIVVRDTTGNESSPVDLSVPPPLVIQSPAVEADAASGTYRVRFTVEGGTPPYLADVGDIADTVYTSPALKLAETLTAKVTDAAGCTVTGRFESGEQPCAFPCDGVAVREGFRFWLPEARPNLPVHVTRLEVRAFEVTDVDGKPHDIGDAVRAALPTARFSLSATDFENGFARWLKAIEGVIAEALREAGIEGDDWFRLEYEAAKENANTGTLFVDRMHCASFTFQIDVTYTQGRQKHHFDYVYSRQGTIIEEPERRLRFGIPPFSVSTSNRCRPDEARVEQCEGTDLRPEIAQEDNTVFVARVPDGDLPVAFLWETNDGIPQVGGGERFEVERFEPVEPTTKVIRLTVFTEKGCTVTVEEAFDIPGR